jgi:hypothetical protein
MYGADPSEEGEREYVEWQKLVSKTEIILEARIAHH